MSVGIDTWHARLTAARRLRGYKKNQFAKLVGVAPPTVTGWENGDTQNLDSKYLIKVCSVLEITPEWLLERIGPSPLTEPEPIKTENTKAEDTKASEAISSQSQMCNPMMLTDAETRHMFAYRRAPAAVRAAINVLTSTFEPDSE
jgi:transcriptional regulator with XRE-family HTH domain